jgi:hypothetical protein
MSCLAEACEAVVGTASVDVQEAAVASSVAATAKAGHIANPQALRTAVRGIGAVLALACDTCLAMDMRVVQRRVAVCAAIAAVALEARVWSGCWSWLAAPVVDVVLGDWTVVLDVHIVAATFDVHQSALRLLNAFKEVLLDQGATDIQKLLQGLSSSVEGVAGVDKGVLGTRGIFAIETSSLDGGGSSTLHVIGNDEDLWHFALDLTGAGDCGADGLRSKNRDQQLGIGCKMSVHGRFARERIHTSNLLTQAFNIWAADLATWQILLAE